jgi:hypothetical protein
MDEDEFFECEQEHEAGERRGEEVRRRRRDFGQEIEEQDTEDDAGTGADQRLELRVRPAPQERIRPRGRK